MGNVASNPFARTDHEQPSVFRPENLLREARRQRGLAEARVPAICLLDPDGDIADHVGRSGGAARSPAWACYHTELLEALVDGRQLGIVGRAVGAPFAVLVAEELFASGCELLISITSAGKVAPDLPQPSIILIDRALRGEGTSFAYLPPAPAVSADAALVAAVECGLAAAGIDAIRGIDLDDRCPLPRNRVRARRRGGGRCAGGRDGGRGACTPSPPRAAGPSSASPTSPTPSPSTAAISRRVRPKAPNRRWRIAAAAAQSWSEWTQGGER